MSAYAETASDHVRAADAAIAKAREAVTATSAAAKAARDHRDGLIRASGAEQAFADRHYRAFAEAVGVPPVDVPEQSQGTAEDDLKGWYPLIESADQSYAALLVAANAAASAAAQAQAHRERLG